MALTIKKSVDLASVGDEYKGIQLIFKSIPAKDLADLDNKQQGFDKDKDGNPKSDLIIPFFIEILQKYFLSGTQDNEKVVKEDIANLDATALIYCFEILSGQAIDPKAGSESTSTSTTDTEKAEK